MSDTIKNVRLKDRTGNILHPEITVDAELNSTSENPVQNKVINAKLDEVFQSVSSGKTRIETAITDMGGTVSKSGSVAKTGELISGLATVASAQANIFVQEAEPETKNGLWLKTSNTYDDIVNISGTEDTITYTKLKDIQSEFYEGSAVDIGSDIYLLGGGGRINNYKYDTTTDTYTQMTNIPYDFYYISAVAIGSDIYLLGGDTYHNNYNYKYDTTTNTYTKMADIPYGFYYASAVAIGNDIYLLGGDISRNYNYKYDTTTNTYTQMTDIPYNFYLGSAVAIGGDIYLLGSYQSSGCSTNNYKYDTTTDTYTKMTNIPYDFDRGSAVAIGNDIYILGGYYNKKYNYKYDTTTNTYTQMTDIPYDFYSGGAVIIDNKVYLLRGKESQKTNYRIDFTILDKNSIVFLNSNMPFKHKTKMFNTPYGVLNYINFDSVIMTDENGNNANVETYIGNGTEWTKISA